MRPRFPLETENSEKESTPTSSKISKKTDFEKAELPFRLGDKSLLIEILDQRIV
jgi:hypothetical protein